MSTITITEDGLLNVNYPAQPDESHTLAALSGGKWTILGSGTTGALTVTDGASGVIDDWILVDPAGIPWQPSLSDDGILSLSSFDKTIVIAPGINTVLLVNGLPAVGAQIFAYQAGTSIPATLYQNGETISILSQPILVNDFGLPTDPIFVQVGLAYDFFIVPPGGGNPFRARPAVVGGVPVNLPTATEWSGGSYYASFVDAASVQVSGDVRGIFVPGRRVKVYPYPLTGLVLSSSYDGQNTTIVTTMDAGSIDNSVVSIAAATLTPNAGPMPARRHIGISTYLTGNLTIPIASGLNLVPVGLIMLRSSGFSGWLQCNGAAISRTQFSTLFGAITTVFGAGDGSTTFNVPTIADSGASHYWIYAEG